MSTMTPTEALLVDILNKVDYIDIVRDYLVIDGSVTLTEEQLTLVRELIEDV